MARKPPRGKPELDDGYTKIANELLEQFVKLNLSSTQWKILMLIVRETYGYHRTAKALAISYIAKAIGASEFRTGKAVKDLIRKKILIEYSAPTPRASRELGLNKYYLDWVRPHASVTSGPTQTRPHATVTSDPTQTRPHATVTSDPTDALGLDPTQPLPNQRKNKDTSKEKALAAKYRRIEANFTETERRMFGD